MANNNSEENQHSITELVRIVRDLTQTTGKEVESVKERLMSVEHSSRNNAAALESIYKRIDKIEEDRKVDHRELIAKISDLNLDFVKMGAEQHEKRLQAVEMSVEHLKAFMWKAIGISIAATSMLTWLLTWMLKRY